MSVSLRLVITSKVKLYTFDYYYKLLGSLLAGAREKLPTGSIGVGIFHGSLPPGQIGDGRQFPTVYFESSDEATRPLYSFMGKLYKQRQKLNYPSP